MVVFLQVTAETTDSFSQHRNLNFRGPSVRAMGLVRVDQLLLLARVKRHSARRTPIHHYTARGETGPMSPLFKQERFSQSGFQIKLNDDKFDVGGAINLTPHNPRNTIHIVNL